MSPSMRVPSTSASKLPSANRTAASAREQRRIHVGTRGIYRPAAAARARPTVAVRRQISAASLTIRFATSLGLIP